MAKEFKLEWGFGANFYPSTAINQLEMWQEESFDAETIDRELGFAEKIGMTYMRVYLHDLLWEQDSEGFLKRMEKYLEIADSHKIKTMFVFFDDCWSPVFALGKQPDPKPFTHNSGWIQSPGNKAADDLSQRPRLEAYVKGVLTHFANDERIFLWDLYNEPGNGASGDHVTVSALREELSFPLLKDVFKWAREVNPSQPITAAPWCYNREGFFAMNKFMYENSDVITFHCYMDGENTEKRINAIIDEYGDKKPLLCSEYMARTAKSTFEACLPIYKKYNISAINWGLVSGKSQTIYPWSWTEEKGKPEFWFHDVFNQDGTLLYPEEGKVFEAVLKK